MSYLVCVFAGNSQKTEVIIRKKKFELSCSECDHEKFLGKPSCIRVEEEVEEAVIKSVELIHVKQ